MTDAAAMCEEKRALSHADGSSAAMRHLNEKSGPVVEGVLTGDARRVRVTCPFCGGKHIHLASADFVFPSETPVRDAHCRARPVRRPHQYAIRISDHARRRLRAEPAAYAEAQRRSKRLFAYGFLYEQAPDLPLADDVFARLRRRLVRRGAVLPNRRTAPGTPIYRVLVRADDLAIADPAMAKLLQQFEVLLFTEDDDFAEEVRDMAAD
jgi:hypothetical protein